MKKHTVMIGRIVRPQSYFLVIEGVHSAHNLSLVPFVKLSELLECINADYSGTRIFAPDIFGAYAHLSHVDDTRGMTWISSSEYEINGDRIPTEFRCEIYIPESWSDKIIHILRCRRAVAKLFSNPISTVSIHANHANS